MKLIEEHKKINFDKKDITLLKNIYWSQAVVTDETPVHRGLRQGCVMSPDLFNLYCQEFWMEELQRGSFYTST